MLLAVFLCNGECSHLYKSSQACTKPSLILPCKVSMVYSVINYSYLYNMFIAKVKGEKSTGVWFYGPRSNGFSVLI